MRVLFSCIPGEGHFSPLLPLARALAGRGHDVAFALAEDWRNRTEEEGFESLVAGPSMAEVQARFAPEREQIFRLPPEQRRPLQFSALFGRLFAPAKLPALLDEARSWHADAIVYDSGDLAAPIAATVARATVREPLVRGDDSIRGARAARPYVEPLWRSEGLEPDPYAGAFRGLYVDLAPQSFAWEQPRGSVIRLRPASATDEPRRAWLAELELPLVYVTIGTVYNEPALFRALLDGLDGHSALVTVGRNVDPAGLGLCRGACASSASCRRRTCCRAARPSSRTAAPERPSARSRTACRSCSCRKPPTSSTTPPAPSRWRRRCPAAGRADRGVGAGRARGVCSASRRSGPRAGSKARSQAMADRGRGGHRGRGA